MITDEDSGRLLSYVLLASQGVQLSIISLTMTRSDERIFADHFCSNVSHRLSWKRANRTLTILLHSTVADLNRYLEIISIQERPCVIVIVVFIVGLQHLRGYLQIISSGHLFPQTDDITWGPKMGCSASLTKLDPVW